MKKYNRRVRENGGKKLGTVYGRRFTDIPMAEFDRLFRMKENG